MLNYMVRRVLFAIVAIIGVSFVSFLIIEMAPGDFVSAYEMRLIQMGGMSRAEAEKAGEVVRERYGLTGPIHERYFQWAKGIVTQGDFGPAMAYGGKEVTELILERLPRTLLVAVLAHAISSVVGIAIGIYVAPRQYSLSDNLAALAAFFMTSAPRFALALIMMYWLVFGLGQEHVSSFHSPEYVLAPWSWDKVVDFVKHIWPVVLIAGLGGVVCAATGEAIATAARAESARRRAGSGIRIMPCMLARRAGRAIRHLEVPLWRSHFRKSFRPGTAGCFAARQKVPTYVGPAFDPVVRRVPAFSRAAPSSCSAGWGLG